jgi:hypothetical protein
VVRKVEIKCIDSIRQHISGHLLRCSLDATTSSRASEQQQAGSFRHGTPGRFHATTAIRHMHSYPWYVSASCYQDHLLTRCGPARACTCCIVYTASIPLSCPSESTILAHSPFFSLCSSCSIHLSSCISLLSHPNFASTIFSPLSRSLLAAIHIPSPPIPSRSNL